MALGFLTVPTHLFGAAALGIWMFARGPEVGFKRIIKVWCGSVALSLVVLVPLLFFVLFVGTKIEPKEEFFRLPSAIAGQILAVLTYWRSEHTLVFMLWIGVGWAAVAGSVRTNRTQAVLAISLLLGPFLVCLLTRRPPPYPRVWTYLLPSLFICAALGWVRIISFVGGREKFRVRVLSLCLTVPIVFCLIATVGEVSSVLKSSSQDSAEHAYSVFSGLIRPGDHIAMDHEFFDQVWAVALMKNSVDFVFDPLSRRSGEIKVIQQNGRETRKENPFDPIRPGRVFLYMTSSRQVEAMKTWLAPYVPVGKRLDVHSLGISNRIFEFRLSEARSSTL